MSVLCPKCGKEGLVYDTRLENRIKRRRRKCEACDERWSTWESGDNRDFRALQLENMRYRNIISGIRAALGGKV